MTDKNEKNIDIDGVRVIRSYVRNLSSNAGVYRMIDESGKVLYVGKAKHLKNRVTAYTKLSNHPIRLQRMIARTRHMEFIQTRSEAEALLLEAHLIKHYAPPFNIRLRDDKSFAYLKISKGHDFPQLTKYRGNRDKQGDYFGPFASAADVNRTLTALQKAFLLRNCSDHDFATRTRPCLQYQIKRCSAPCVGVVEREQYAAQVKQAKDFLTGRSRQIHDEWQQEMQRASDALDYERAAQFRDRIRAMTSILASQDIHNIRGVDDVDIVALVMENGRAGVQLVFYRNGSHYGNRSYFPSHDSDDTADNILASFLAQFYADHPTPPDILVSQTPADLDLLIRALSDKAERRIKIQVPQKGIKKELVERAMMDARQSLAGKAAKLMATRKIHEDLADIFGLPHPPERIEIYDNSHLSGTNPVGAMVVADADGFVKNAYRLFNIKQAAGDDDYGMMREVMQRRFKDFQKNEKNDMTLPDLLLIDGGQGQLSAVLEILDEIGLDKLPVVAISKGTDRNAGREKFHQRGKSVFELPQQNPCLFYLQTLRDEAHRFAVGRQQARRKKTDFTSPLDAISGIGGKRKKALLLHFGSARGVAQATIRDLEKIDGISKQMAEQIYNHFHDT